MGPGFYVSDAQALSFLVSQVSHIEAAMVRVAYPDIQYPRLVPVDTSAPEWAKSITWFSMDRIGQAAWFNHQATDLRLADITREKKEQGIEMAAIGYRYTLEELGQAMMIPNTNLTAEKAMAARRAAEEMLDEIALRGSTEKNWPGLINNTQVTAVTAPNDGAASATTWASKTVDQVARDIANLLSGVYQGTLQTELPDTLLLPLVILGQLSARFMPNSGVGLIEWLTRNNPYTYVTGNPLTIAAVRGLETAGAGATARAAVYRRDPQVLRFHVPMPHRFLDIWQTGPMIFDVPGVFRTGGVEVRRPGAMRYMDGV